MRIALFGGRFDPIHNGHLAVAREVLQVGAADTVLFSVENQHQWRPIVVSPKDRIAMVKLAIEGIDGVGIDTTPIALGGLTETLSVVRTIRKKIKDDIIFLCGSDQLKTFHRWTHWQELQKEVQFLIVARKGSPLENIPPNAHIIDDPTYQPLEDSATQIRERIKMGKSISGLVPEKVEKYIIEQQLYV